MHFLLLSIALLLSIKFGFNLESYDDQIAPSRQLALLIAGSHGWQEYADQANVCDAYQIIRSHGIAEKNIITMMYDDIADNPRNPHPKQIFHSPYGPDVYENVKIDYKGYDVTKGNVIAVLTGNSSAVKGGNGRVLGSTASDKIFIYFSGHGFRGLLSIMSEPWYASEINDLLENMHSNRQYYELLFYIQSDYSGSIFDGLLTDGIKVYAITSAGPTEFSYPNNCFTKKINDTCLSHDFSTQWMEDVENQLLEDRSLGSHYEAVKKAVSSSGVTDYGSSFMKEVCVVGEFMGWR